jgi:hypothetical protein
LQSFGCTTKLQKQETSCFIHIIKEFTYRSPWNLKLEPQTFEPHLKEFQH